jgi:hypothetical protein
LDEWKVSDMARQPTNVSDRCFWFPGLLVTAALLVGWAGQPAGRAANPVGRATVDFNRDIRPILSDNCFACHGPDAKQRKAKLRLDTQDGILAELRDGGHAIVPGKATESVLLQRVTAENPKERMPPAKTGKRLTAQQIILLRQWIEEGAPWSKHWAFIPPKRPPLPKVADTAWPVNPSDYFILARLEKAGLQPTREADRTTLLRRVTLDLTGLPPTPAEVDAFLADPSPQAYERAVDRLLESPRYGEHMARYWLDAARYGDTHGLHLDNYREIWPYRDWVIRAFNTNKPYDRFLIQQLAGDLLPNPTLDQFVATGYNRCHVSTSEGGSIEDEVYVRNVVDQVDTNGTALLGLTIGCARCHDHKFDPIRQKDFYQLFAFFNSIDGPALDGNRKDTPPAARVPTEAQRGQLAEAQAKIADALKRRQARVEQAGPAFTAWLAEIEKKHQTEGSAARSKATTQGLLAYYPLDEKTGDKVHNAAGFFKSQGTVKGKATWSAGKVGGALTLDGKTHVDLGNTGDFERTDSFSYGAWVRLTTGNGTPLARMEDKNAYRGYDLFIVNDQVMVHIISKWPDNALKVVVPKKIKRNEWTHLFVTYDGSSKAAGIKVYINGKAEPVTVERDRLTDSIKTKVSLKIGTRTFANPLTGQVDDVRLYRRRLNDTEVAALAGADPLAGIAPILAVAPAKRTAQQQNALRQFYLDNYDAESIKLGKELEALRAAVKKIEDGFTTTLVFKERSTPRPAYILKRGEYDQRGDAVGRDTPAFLPPMPANAPRNRLGFAQWLVAADHPLTARVAVNRFWQQLFGTGIVKTAEDFGTQGEPPSHPELLDWLAVQFVEDGWNVKKMMKRLVMSATYRQASQVTPDRLAKDLDNRLLSRGPRFRLDAEVLRDQALAVSGLLIETVGGPSVKPPQPRGLWEAVGYTRSNTAQFVADTGQEKVHRRSLYTFWKRTSPPPQMSILDAPSREACTVRRERTDTPLQALLLLNERQFVEAARALAEKAMREGGTTPEARLAYLFRRATARRPDARELSELTAAYDRLLAKYRRDVKAAQELIRVGESKPDPALNPSELAAWTMVANLVLNLDEVINKG